MGGIITDLKKLITKSNTTMMFLTVEDIYGPIEVVVFPKVFDKAKSALNAEEVVKVSGKIQIKDGTPQIIAEDVTKFEIENQQVAAEQKGKKEFLVLMLNEKDDEKIDNILDVLVNYPGDTEVFLVIGENKFRTHAFVRRCEALYSELKNYLEEKSIVVLSKTL